jgi:thioredoxin reductase (NADPH)
MSEHDVIIIGGGPAGMTAGLYASRAGSRCLLIERGAFGGQMINARVVRTTDSPGNSRHRIGIACAMTRNTACRLFSPRCPDSPGAEAFCSDDRGTFETRAIVPAAGSQYRQLNAGEKQFTGRGVSYCAACDGLLPRSGCSSREGDMLSAMPWN